METHEGEPNIGGLGWFFGAFPVCFLLIWLLAGQHPAYALGLSFAFAAFRAVIASPFLKVAFGYPSLIKPLDGNRVILLIFTAGAIDGLISSTAVYSALIHMPVSALLYMTLAVGLLLMPILMLAVVHDSGSRLVADAHIDVGTCAALEKADIARCELRPLSTAV